MNVISSVFYSSFRCGAYYFIAAILIEVVWLSFLNIFSYFDLIYLIDAPVRKYLDWGMAHYNLISILPFAEEYFMSHRSPDGVPDNMVELSVVLIVGVISFLISYVLCCVFHILKKRGSVNFPPA